MRIFFDSLITPGYPRSSSTPAVFLSPRDGRQPIIPPALRCITYFHAANSLIILSRSSRGDRSIIIYEIAYYPLLYPQIFIPTFELLMLLLYNINPRLFILSILLDRYHRYYYYTIYIILYTIYYIILLYYIDFRHMHAQFRKISFHFSREEGEKGGGRRVNEDRKREGRIRCVTGTWERN